MQNLVMFLILCARMDFAFGFMRLRNFWHLLPFRMVRMEMCLTPIYRNTPYLTCYRAEIGRSRSNWAGVNRGVPKILRTLPLFNILGVSDLQRNTPGVSML